VIRLLPRRPDGGPLRILCLGAHADDVEIGCGGTLLRLVDEWAPVSVRYVVFSATPARADEARASAAALLTGAAETTVDVHGFRESYFPWAGAEIKDAFAVLKRAFSPDLIFTHRREDLHQDHRTIAELTWNTFRDHLVLEYEIPKYEGDLGTPGVFVPLGDAVARRKVEHVLKHFPSQAGRSWFRASTFEALLRLRGVECNAPDGWAEAFHVRKLVF
jgi:LmbE family N-acetylglucosaminyl deacetylase